MRGFPPADPTRRHYSHLNPKVLARPRAAPPPLLGPRSVWRPSQCCCKIRLRPVAMETSSPQDRSRAEKRRARTATTPARRHTLLRPCANSQKYRWPGACADGTAPDTCPESGLLETSGSYKLPSPPLHSATKGAKQVLGLTI